MINTISFGRITYSQATSSTVGLNQRPVLPNPSANHHSPVQPPPSDLSGLANHFKGSQTKRTTHLQIGTNNHSSQKPTFCQKYPHSYYSIPEVYKHATKFDFLHPNSSIIKVTPYDTTRKTQQALFEAAGNPKSGIEFEGITGKALKKHGYNIEYSNGFFEPDNNGVLGQVCEVDFTVYDKANPEKPISIIEVTLTDQHTKLGQFERYLDPSRNIVAADTPIIFYAPKYPENAAQEIVKAGKGRVHLVKTQDDLLTKLSELSQIKEK